MPFGKKKKKNEGPPNPEQIFQFCDSLFCEPYKILFKAPAHFLGRKAPTPSVDGLESIQKPLLELYTARSCDSLMARDIPGDVYLVVMCSGLLIIPINPLDSTIWIRMQEFRGCGAVKGFTTLPYQITNVCSFKFIPIGSKEAKTSPLPAIFTIVAARNSCVPLLDCYAFSVPNDDLALTLMELTQITFSNRSGWTDSKKPPKISLIDLDQNFFGTNNLCSNEQVQKPFNHDLYQKPPLQGFFYTPNSGLIKNYDIGYEADFTQVCQKVEVEETSEEECSDQTSLVIINQQVPQTSRQGNIIFHKKCNNISDSNQFPFNDGNMELNRNNFQLERKKQSLDNWMQKKD